MKKVRDLFIDEDTLVRLWMKDREDETITLFEGEFGDIPRELEEKLVVRVGAGIIEVPGLVGGFGCISIRVSRKGS